MDTFRLILSRLVFSLLLGGISFYSHSETLRPVGPLYGTPPNLTDADTKVSAICKGEGNAGGHATSLTTGKCLDASGNEVGGFKSILPMYICPPSYTNVGVNGVCNYPACPTGQTRNQANGLCETKCAIAENDEVPGIYSISRADANAGGAVTKCLDNCRVYGPAGDVVKTATTVTGKFYSYGSTCGVSDVPPKTLPPDSPEFDCAKKGMGSGTVNGQVICVPPTDKEEKKKEVNTPPPGTPPDPSKPETVPSTTETTTNTTCSGAGSCTTTTTTTVTSGGTTPDGSAPSKDGTGPGAKTESTTKTEEQPKSSFCEENPNSAMCKDSSFAGSCDSAPACTGDAVQCAQASAAFEMKCSMVKDDDLQKLARNVVSGTDPKAGSFPDANSPTVIPVGTLNTTETFTAQCPKLPGFSFLGRSYSFDTKPLCDLADPIGKLMILGALMGALWIISGSIRGA